MQKLRHPLYGEIKGTQYGRDGIPIDLVEQLEKNKKAQKFVHVNNEIDHLLFKDRSVIKEDGPAIRPEYEPNKFDGDNLNRRSKANRMHDR